MADDHTIFVTEETIVATRQPTLGDKTYRDHKHFNYCRHHHFRRRHNHHHCHRHRYNRRHPGYTICHPHRDYNFYCCLRYYVTFYVTCYVTFYVAHPQPLCDFTKFTEILQSV